MARVKKREDVNPDEGERTYGDVTFADETNHKYPIDSAEHVRAAWSYINKAGNAEKYTKADAERIRAKIKAAAPRFDVDIAG